ncbi:MAG: hypothetical protein MZU95_10665 [Desulfomicrobium escambiense]|nr:hypothetical protein [Desulfomicrobium escambiense]
MSFRPGHGEFLSMDQSVLDDFRVRFAIIDPISPNFGTTVTATIERRTITMTSSMMVKPDRR